MSCNGPEALLRLRLPCPHGGPGTLEEKKSGANFVRRAAFFYTLRPMQFKSVKASSRRFTKFSSPLRNQTRGS